MISSEVAICNLSLSWLGGNRISALSEDSTEAELCDDNYVTARDAVLEMVNWTFASARKQLAQDTNGPDFGYTYSYTLPSSCLWVTMASKEETFQLAMDTVREGTKMLANDSTMFIKYIQRITDVTKFPALFVNAVASQLGAMIAVPLTHSSKKETEMLKKLEFYLNAAAGHDGSQGNTQVLRSTTLTGVR